MKYIILFSAFLFASTLLAQRGNEIKSEKTTFHKGKNECGDSVYTLKYSVVFRSGRIVSDSLPVGYDENNLCSGIRVGDTLGLVNFYARPWNDYGRGLAEKAPFFVFQNQRLKGFRDIDKALKDFKMPSPLAQIEKEFIDSLVGNYILVRPGVANTNVTVTKTAQGQGRIRISAQNFFPLVIYSDRLMTANNLGGTDQPVDLFQLEPGRWVSLLGNYQLVKDARQVVQRGVK